jgi:hypothetical protein
MADLSDADIMVLMRTLQWIPNDRRSQKIFIYKAQELRRLLRVRPETFGVTHDDLKRIAILFGDIHTTEDCELRFQDGVSRWLFGRIPERPEKEHRGGSGQTHKDGGNNWPICVKPRKKW